MFSLSLPWAYLYLLYYIFWAAYIIFGVFTINLFLNSPVNPPHAILLALIIMRPKLVYMHLQLSCWWNQPQPHIVPWVPFVFKWCLRSMSRQFILLSHTCERQQLMDSIFVYALFHRKSIYLSTKWISQLILDLIKNWRLKFVYLAISCTQLSSIYSCHARLVSTALVLLVPLVLKGTLIGLKLLLLISVSLNCVIFKSCHRINKTRLLQK